MIEENVKNILKEIESGNNLGEKITLVGVTKYSEYPDVERAIRSGITDIGENHAQEIVKKYPLLTLAVKKHFIGHLQQNKVKYVVGAVDLIQSVDSYELASAISERANKLGIRQKCLMQVNIGLEENKHGFSPNEAVDAYGKLKELTGIEFIGIMAMLPKSEDEKHLSELCLQARAIYDTIKKEGDYLSLGMSEDYRLAIKNGSNMIRLGRNIFLKD